jgi:exodeoxyribonuclease VII small subunit
MARESKKKPETFEERLSRLEALVTRLEAGNLPLEDAVTAFEEGMDLAKGLSAALDAAEKRVETLLVADDGTVTKQPFAVAADEDAADEDDDAADEEHDG